MAKWRLREFLTTAPTTTTTNMTSNRVPAAIPSQANGGRVFGAAGLSKVPASTDTEPGGGPERPIPEMLTAKGF